MDDATAATPPEVGDDGPSADYTALTDILTERHWSEWRGTLGSMWTSPDHNAQVAIPHAITRRNWEWAGILTRTHVTEDDIDRAARLTYP